MGLLERMWGALAGRVDAAPLALPTAPMVTQHQRRDSIVNPFTGLGGLGDKGASGRPSPFHIPLNYDERQVLYNYNGHVRRIVDIVPQRACRRGWSVPKIGDEDRRLLTWGRTCTAMSMSRLDGISGMAMITEDDVPAGYRNRPEEWLRQPLDLERIGRLSAIQVFDAREARITKWDTDVRSTGYRGPAEWQISADGFRASVHASRMIWFRGAQRPPSQARGGWGSEGIPDDSCLQAIWQEVLRLTQTLQGGAVLALEIRESVLKIGDLKAMMTGDDAGALENRISAMHQGRGVLGVTLIGEGDDFQSRSNPPTGWAELSSGAWEALSAATGIPQVILLGSTPGGLNTDGESSFEGFRQLISSYQESHRHELERLYSVIYAAQDGPTGGEAPEGWNLVFSPLDEPKEQVVAEMRQTVAETDAVYIQSGVYTAEDVRRSRFGPAGWSFDLVDVEEPAAEPAAMDPAPVPVGAPADPVPSPNAEPAAK